MAYIRPLPSGLYQATVRHPSGKRYTKTERLRKVVANWAADLEAEWRAGSRRDPRAGEITLRELHDEHFLPTRSVSKGHQSAAEGRWRRHIEPHFGNWRLCDIVTSDVAAWAVALQAKPANPARPAGRRLSATTVRHCVSYLHTMLELARRNGWILTNAASLQPGSLPARPAVKTDFYTHQEIGRLLGWFDLRYQLWLELGAYTGLRWEELAGLPARHVDVPLELLHVRQVMERDGAIREYAKSVKSHRSVPIPEHLVGQVADWVQGMRPGELLFTSPGGGHLQYHNFLNRIWYPALRSCSPATCHTWVRGGAPCRRPEHQRMRDLGIHGLRHTAASWLVMAGVDLYRVQEIMGHEKASTTQRYAHLRPDAFDPITQAWAAMTHQRRTGLGASPPIAL